MSRKTEPKPSRMESPRHARIGRFLTLIGYLSLLALILNWFTWIAPPEQVPRSLPLAVLAIPLLFPLRGIIHAKRYTHQWVGFLSLLYFMIGIDTWYNRIETVSMLGVAMTGFSLLILVGSTMYVRYTPTPANQRKLRPETPPSDLSMPEAPVAQRRSSQDDDRNRD